MLMPAGPAAMPRRALPWVINERVRSHKRRCATLPAPSEAELARMVEEFHRRGGAVTALSPAYSLPTTAAKPAPSHQNV